MKVGVIDYGVGNLGSISRSLDHLGVTPILIESSKDVCSADCLILPGVGNFTECKQRLDKADWVKALQDWVLGDHKPLLGICLGMQLLADSSTEGAVDGSSTPGLGLVPGQVRKLARIGCSLRLPHMGWNSLILSRSCSLLDKIPDETDFYFVHSYAFEPKYREDVYAVTNYEIPITAVIGRGSVWGTQFHPEKSSRAGFQILQNFVEYQKC